MIPIINDTLHTWQLASVLVTLVKAVPISRFSFYGKALSEYTDCAKSKFELVTYL